MHFADLAFEYGDADSFLEELAELYSYSEEEEIYENGRCFSKWWQTCCSNVAADVDSDAQKRKWSELTPIQRRCHMDGLVENLELCNADQRMSSVRALLYLLQGCYMEAATPVAIVHQITLAAYQLYEIGAYPLLCSLLAMQLQTDKESESALLRKPASSIDDNRELRLILSAIYTMVETLRRIELADALAAKQVPGMQPEKIHSLRISFITELGHPICGYQSLTLVLFNMITRFCSGSAPHYPMRKVLLLLWKTVLTWLGGWTELREIRAGAREAAGLDPALDDTLLVASMMLAAKPPTFPVPGESMDMQDGMGADFKNSPPGNNKNGSNENNVGGGCNVGPPFHPSRAYLTKRQFACVGRNNSDEEEGEDAEMLSPEDLEEGGLGKLDADEAMVFGNGGDGNNACQDGGMGKREDVNDDGVGSGDEGIDVTDDMRSAFEMSQDRGCSTPMPGGSDPNDTPNELCAPSIFPYGTKRNNSHLVLQHKTLPWAPKIREKDIETFLEAERKKFFGFQLPSDRTTLAGLPQPIQDSIKALRRHVYVSMTEVQEEAEERYNKYIFSQKEPAIEETPTEILYRTALPQLPQFLIALLKILLAAAPTTRPKNDTLNILVDVLPNDIGEGVESSMKFALDLNRHKEIIVKAISALLLLLLKHFKAGHVCQFEYVGQHLVFANCIPLILKFFDQNVLQYIQSKSNIPIFNFPNCVLYYAKHGEAPPATSELTPDLMAWQESPGFYLWRNVFASINLLRILNKLTKWKHSRTMMLVVFKSAPILKRTLRVRHILCQLYALKLLKMQAKYLGRQWRKTNMEIMSAIYSKVRHRLNDDWAYGNETNAKPWDFQQQECVLRSNLEKFNIRRYGEGISAATSFTDSAVSNSAALFNDPEFHPYDSNILSVLGGSRFTLSELFRQHYEKWLDREVFKAKINWDQLVTNSATSDAAHRRLRTASDGRLISECDNLSSSGNMENGKATKGGKAEDQEPTIIEKMDRIEAHQEVKAL